jgi:deoxyribonuclease-4
MIVGAHVSIAGGIANSISNAEKIGCETFQIFTKNQNQWREKVYSIDELSAFKSAIVPSPYQTISIAAHNSYLINLCSPDDLNLDKSRRALLAEIKRCHTLGIGSLILHPGSHLGKGEIFGINLIIESIIWSLDQHSEAQPRLLLETTAGQGSNLGSTFEQLRAIMDGVNEPVRIGVCIDTCHIFAAGYDIRSIAAYQNTFAEIDDIIGFERVYAFHLNDSKRDLGERIDRHEQIGKGKIGKMAFRLLMNDERFKDTPAYLEIPGDENEYAANIELLKQMRETD